MIESLRRFSVTKLLSSPALPSLLSSLFSLPVQAVAGKKARTSAADSLTAAPDGGKGWRKAKGGKRCNAISGSTILKPLLFSSVEDRGVKSFELKRDSIAPPSTFFFLLLYLHCTQCFIQCLSKLSLLLFVTSFSVEKYLSQFFLKIIQFECSSMLVQRNREKCWIDGGNWKKKKKRKKKGASRSTNEWQIDFVRLLPFSTPSIRARGMRSISSRVINNI